MNSQNGCVFRSYRQFSHDSMWNLHLFIVISIAIWKALLCGLSSCCNMLHKVEVVYATGNMLQLSTRSNSSSCDNAHILSTCSAAHAWQFRRKCIGFNRFLHCVASCATRLMNTIKLTNLNCNIFARQVTSSYCRNYFALKKRCRPKLGEGRGGEKREKEREGMRSFPLSVPLLPSLLSFDLGLCVWREFSQHPVPQSREEPYFDQHIATRHLQHEW